MYEPVFNSVLVLIDDKDAEWGSGNDESMLGKSFSKGTIVQMGYFVPVDKYPLSEDDLNIIYKDVSKLKGKKILWNEGAEAGTTFEFDDKLFGMIYWWDVRGVSVGAN